MVLTGEHITVKADSNKLPIGNLESTGLPHIKNGLLPAGEYTAELLTTTAFQTAKTKGATAVVHEAKHAKNGRIAALKIVPAEHAGEAAVPRRGVRPAGLRGDEREVVGLAATPEARR
jgi:hypothetical protein